MPKNLRFYASVVHVLFLCQSRVFFLCEKFEVIAILRKLPPFYVLCRRSVCVLYICACAASMITSRMSRMFAVAYLFPTTLQKLKPHSANGDFRIPDGSHTSALLWGYENQKVRNLNLNLFFSSLFHFANSRKQCLEKEKPQN